MASSADFLPITLTGADERMGRRQMREMLGRSWWRKRGRAAWAGFAAEAALLRGFDTGGFGLQKSDTLLHDLELVSLHPRGTAMPIEVKTRAVARGWVHPEKFDYITVPMHQNREPIKPHVLNVWFCWYSMDMPRLLWVLGYVCGLQEFQDRAVWYAEGEPLPRGGWASEGGAYVIEVKQLRPFPAGMFKEVTAS